MAGLLDLLPLFPGNDEAAILERMRADANEGLDPAVDVEEWVDTRQGSHWYNGAMPGVREFARMWDSLGTETVAACMVMFAWSDYLDAHAQVVEIVRLPGTLAQGEVTFTGPEGTVIPVGFTLSIEAPTPDAEVPEFATLFSGTIDRTGELTLAVRATEYGTFGNVAAGAISVFATPEPAIGMTVTNADPTLGGTEPETDEGLRERVFQAYRGKGPGNKFDYERWGRAWPGVGRVTVIPLWRGASTVKLIVTDAAGGPLPDETVAALQADLDPIPGQSEGTAPVGAHVTVVTATGLRVVIAATVEFEEGYSLDGDAATIALRTDITDEERDYVERVESGGEVVLMQVAARIASIDGVHDVGDVTINGAARNLSVSSDPAEAPQLVTPLDLTEGTV